LNKLNNEKGYITIESTIIVPLLLLLTTIFIVFFYFYLKIGAFQALVNHQRLTESLNTTGVFRVEQLVDRNSELTMNQNTVSTFDEFVKIKQSLQMKVTAPFGKSSFVVEAESEELKWPYIYQLAISKTLGENLEGIREKLKGRDK
jgi:hypothetical protein